MNVLLPSGRTTSSQAAPKIPPGWIWVSIGEIGEVVTGRTPDTRRADYFGPGLPFVTPGDLGEDLIVRRAARELTDAGAAQVRPLPSNTALVTCIASIGKVGLAVVPCASNQQINAVIPIEKCVEPRWLCYAVASPWFIGILRSEASSTVVPILNKSRFQALPIPLPPLAEQERIVIAIEEQFSRIDAGVEALRRARRNLQRMRAAVLQAAVTGRLVARGPDAEPVEVLVDRISRERRERWNGNGREKPYREPILVSTDEGLPRADHWGLATLEQLTDPVRVICYGILKPRVPNGTVPYVEVRDLIKNPLHPDHLNKTSEMLHREFGRSTIKEGDVLLAIRGSYDRAAVAPASIQGANISRDVARIAPLPGLDARFLSLVLTAPQTQAVLAAKARGVGVKGVNIGDIRRMAIPLPPEAEQRRIVERAEQLLSVIDGLHREIETTIRRGGIIRRAVLAEAFAGRLVPQDSSDEPVEFLLERIRAARAIHKRPPIHARRRSRQ